MAFSQSWATGKPTENKQHQNQSQHSYNKNTNNNRAYGGRGGDGGDAYAKSRSTAKSSSDSRAAADSNANNSLHNDIDVGPTEVATTLDTSNDINQSYDNQIDFESSPVLTLVPQGHTAGCQRTYGISFGNNDSAGGIGWPFRDKDCDYDNEAADAFAAGQMAIGWFWNCHKKSAYKPFRDRGESVEKARKDCHDKMLSMLVTVPPHSPAPPLEVNVEACCKDKRQCGSDHPEIHRRILEKCQSK